jgi:hypothetical protein
MSIKKLGVASPAVVRRFPLRYDAAELRSQIRLQASIVLNDMREPRVAWPG